MKDIARPKVIALKNQIGRFQENKQRTLCAFDLTVLHALAALHETPRIL